MNILGRTIIFLTLICLCLVGLICHIIYEKLQQYSLERHKNYLKKLDEIEADDMDDDVVLHKFQKSYSEQDKIIDMSKMMKFINEKQRIRNARKLNLENAKFETVLVLKVHNNIKHLAVFLDSIRRVRFITKSLLICAHDFYDININLLIKRMPFVKIMQVFYPYATQIYPNIYPGKDARFCKEMNKCISSTRRNTTLAQSKLFWWWVTSQVFDHIDVLKKYEDYIYFLDTEQYLTSDSIHMAKMLEKLQLLFCPECRILSLASRPPRPELYGGKNNTLVVDVWSSNFSTTAIGFNRRTWYEIKYKKQDYCFFNDYGWDRSLQYLVSLTQQKKYLMLSPEAPRVFPTTGCGAFRNGSDCSLDRIFLDIQDFLPKIREGLFPETFKLKTGAMETEPEVVEARGEWEDARDREFCMFLASRTNRV